MSRLQGKFLGLEKRLNAELFEREEVVSGLLCAALAGEHVLLLGPPGTAKSALASQFCGGVKGAKYFEWLLSKFSAPEELFGPISLQGLKADKYERKTAGKLPEAHVAFLDEIFKANSAILNSLLTAINERKFHNNGTASQIPLKLVIGASNELPEGPELEALYDRFLLRYWVGYIKNPESFIGMIQASEPQLGLGVTLREWETAQGEVAALPFDELVVQCLYRLRVELQKENLVVSDRRWKRCVRLLQARAWLDGATEVDSEQFDVLRAALWNSPDERETVDRVVGRVAVGVGVKAKKVADLLIELIEQIPKNPPEMTRELQENLITASREGNLAEAKLVGFLDEAKSEKQKDFVKKQQERVGSVLAPIKALARESLGL